MKLLKWHKLANESAIQAALLRTKNLKKIDQRKKIEEEHQEREERKIRFQIIIEEEKAKPIEVGTCTCFEKESNAFLAYQSLLPNLSLY